MAMSVNDGGVSPETLNFGCIIGTTGLLFAVLVVVVFCSLGILNGVLSGRELADGVGTGSRVCCLELRRDLKSVKRFISETECFELSLIRFLAAETGFLNHLSVVSSGEGLLCFGKRRRIKAIKFIKFLKTLVSFALKKLLLTQLTIDSLNQKTKREDRRNLIVLKHEGRPK